MKKLESYGRIRGLRVLGYDKETKQRKLQPYTDLDGRTTTELLKMAGVNVDDLKYIEPGQNRRW